MPAKYSIKSFAPDSIYHVYNRGVEKRPIFLDEQDFAVMLSYLKTYLMPKDEEMLLEIIGNPESNSKDKDHALGLLRMNNFHDAISLINFCLMDNHFHMSLRQTATTAIDSFMNSLWSRYTRYFNKKHKRVGHLFQGVYKAVPVVTIEQLLHLSRYIHRNPIAHRKFKTIEGKQAALRNYPWSSYPEYIGLRHAAWINPRPVLSYWTHDAARKYKEFILETDNEDSARIIAPIIIAEP